MGAKWYYVGKGGSFGRTFEPGGEDKPVRLLQKREEIGGEKVEAVP